MGYGTIEMKVNNTGVINVSLNRPDAALNEVVVIGYGTAVENRCYRFGGVSVNAKQLQDRAVVSFGEAIAGQLAGVQVQQTSAAAGGGLSLQNQGYKFHNSRK